jgi:hypothetical protein
VRRLVALAAAAGAAFASAATAEGAFACSCVPWGNPRDELARADGAFVGVYLSRRPLTSSANASSGDTYVYRFRVTRRVKGRIGRIIDVRSPRDGAACGLEVTRGQRVSLLLDRRNRAWHSNLCRQRPPAFFRGIGGRFLSACG